MESQVYPLNFFDRLDKEFIDKEMYPNLDERSLKALKCTSKSLYELGQADQILKAWEFLGAFFLAYGRGYKWGKEGYKELLNKSIIITDSLNRCTLIFGALFYTLFFTHKDMQFKSLSFLQDTHPEKDLIPLGHMIYFITGIFLARFSLEKNISLQNSLIMFVSSSAATAYLQSYVYPKVASKSIDDIVAIAIGLFFGAQESTCWLKDIGLVKLNRALRFSAKTARYS
jgi:hypothetical protein